MCGRYTYLGRSHSPACCASHRVVCPWSPLIYVSAVCLRHSSRQLLRRHGWRFWQDRLWGFVCVSGVSNLSALRVRWLVGCIVRGAMSVLLLRPNQLYHHLPRCAHISPPMVNWGWLHALSCQCSKVMAAYPRANVVSVPQGWALQGVCVVGGAPSIITTDAWGWRVYRGGHGSVHHAGSAASHLGKKTLSLTSI